MVKILFVISLSGAGRGGQERGQRRRKEMARRERDDWPGSIILSVGLGSLRAPAAVSRRVAAATAISGRDRLRGHVCVSATCVWQGRREIRGMCNR